MSTSIPPITEHFQYPPPETCIFCNKGPGVSKEHIVAYGLGGNHWIAKASCSDCAARTGAIEGDVLKGEFEAVRPLLGIQSRTKHRDAPTHLPVWIEKNGRRFKKKLPLKDYPMRLHFPVFERAGYLLDRPKLEANSIYTDSFNGRFCSISIGPSAEDVLRKYKGNAIQWKKRYRPSAFAKMIAKFAYTQAAAQGLLTTIQSPSPLVPSMLGLDKFIGHWVGSSKEPFLTIPDELHVVKVITDLEQRLLIGEVQLFCNYGMPRYEVVLGELKS